LVFCDFTSRCFVSGSPPSPFNATWRHQSRDHLIRHMPFPISDPLKPSIYLQRFLRYLHPSISELRPWPIMATWRHPVDTPAAISCRCSIVTECLSPAVFEIMGPSILVSTLTFQGHVTSSITWPFDSPYAVLYWSNGTAPPSPTVYKIFGSNARYRLSTEHTTKHTQKYARTNERIKQLTGGIN